MGARPQASVTHDVAAHDPGRSRAPMRASASRPFLRSYYIYLVLIAVVVVLSVANLDRFELFERGNFLSQDNIVNILRVSAPLLTLAGAFTLLMVSGYIDLSVGSAMSLSAVVYATAGDQRRSVPAGCGARIGAGCRARDDQWVPRRQARDHARDRDTDHAQPLQGGGAAARRGRGLRDQVRRRT